MISLSKMLLTCVYNLISNNAMLIHLYKMCPTIILIRLINLYVFRLDSKNIIWMCV